MSLNSHWFQNGQPSKLNDRKKPSILILNRAFFSFFQLSRLAILEPVGVQRHNVARFKDLQWWKKQIRKTRFHGVKWPFSKGSGGR